MRNSVFHSERLSAEQWVDYGHWNPLEPLSDGFEILFTHYIICYTVYAVCSPYADVHFDSNEDTVEKRVVCSHS